VYDAEKRRLHQQSDLFILPSITENFGLSIAEALAAGLPVITTQGTPWQGLAAHECGWCVERDADSLAEALREAMELSDADRRNMGERGREWMRRQYAWPEIAAEMRYLYEWVLGRGPRPGSVLLNGNGSTDKLRTTSADEKLSLANNEKGA
jgi:glycosyltransferase involved in cell wall biosynthesis